MKPFEFVLIIVSVIIGLALTEFALGMTHMIKVSKTAHLYWPHLIVCFLGFITCLNYWGTVYKLRKVSKWTIPNIGIVFISGMIFYAMTHINFPDPDNFDQNYERHFNETYGIIFSLMICFNISFMLEGLLVRKVRKLKSYVFGLLFSVVIASGILFTNQTYRVVLVVILSIMQIYFMYSTKVIIYEEEKEAKA